MALWSRLRQVRLARAALGVVLAALLLSPALVACGAASDDTYKIGALYAVSGFNSSLGTPEKETVLMLEEQINAKGGINGKKVKVVVYDTESDETKAVTLAKKLIDEDKVLAILGPSSTGETLALADAMQRAQVPLVAAAANVKIVRPVNKWVYTTPPLSDAAAAKVFDHMKSKGIARVAILTDTGGWGTGGKDDILKAAAAVGIQVVAQETYGVNDTDMTVQLTKIKGTDAQAVLVWGTTQGAAIATKNSRQLGMTIPLYQSHGVASQTFIDLAGDAANGVVLPVGRLMVADKLPDSDAQKKLLLAYAGDFRAKYGKAADSFGGYAYDDMMIVTGAIAKAGADRAKIRDEVEKTTGYVGISGVYNLSAENHNGIGKEAFVMVKIVNGKWELESQ